MPDAVSTVNALIAALVTLGVLAGATVLAWHGTINGEAVVGIYTAVLSGGLVGSAVHVGAKQGAAAALATRPQDLGDGTTP